MAVILLQEALQPRQAESVCGGYTFAGRVQPRRAEYVAVIHLQEECSRDGPSKYTGEYVAVILLQEECSRDGLSMGICTAPLLIKQQRVSSRSWYMHCSAFVKKRAECNKLTQWAYALLPY